MTWELCSSHAAIYKAGAGASATATASGAILTQFYNDAVGHLCEATKIDWTNSTLNTPTSEAVAAVLSDLIAKEIIAYDTTGYIGSREAEFKEDLLRDSIQERIKILDVERASTTLKTV